MLLSMSAGINRYTDIQTVNKAALAYIEYQSRCRGYVRNDQSIGQ